MTYTPCKGACLPRLVGSAYKPSGQDAFLYSGGAMIDLGTLGDGTSGCARSINNAGWIVGQSYRSGGTNHHSFLYRDGVMTDLGTFGGDGSEALDINSAGDIVGEILVNGSNQVRLQLHVLAYNLGI